MRKVVDFYKQEAPELYNAMIGERDKVRASLKSISLVSLSPTEWRRRARHMRLRLCLWPHYIIRGVGRFLRALYVCTS